MTVRIDASVEGRLDGRDIASLTRSAAAGDERGWNKLVDEFGGMICGVARSYRLGQADADDVAQTTWLRLIGHISGLNEPARVGSWLATTARRESLRVLRGSQRQVPFGEGHEEPVSSDSPPDAALVLAERNEALSRGFGRLRASDRALLRLCMDDPRPSYEEIAATLDMPVGSVGPTRARALERLRKELEREPALPLTL